ncbi:MAG TPA: cytochrome c oxidase subunit II [Gammaproteobacteria bacterium]|nr:cytochrome c oxidase subunit II [Gammaproteobacteria bacterium]
MSGRLSAVPILKKLFCCSGLLAAASPVSAEYALNLPEPASELTREVYDLHMLTAKIALYITLIVTAVVFYAIFKFRKSKNYEPDQNFHTGKFGTWSWVLVPIIVLGIDLSISAPAIKTLHLIEDKTEADMTVKVIGTQWKWIYEYMEDDVRIVSSMLSEEEAEKAEGEGYLRTVDNPLVLPVGKRIRFLHTATDVLHAWWVPSITVKKDSIPGYITETWTIIDKEGLYHGQCAENCGRGHSYMPIQVAAVSQAEYDEWLNNKKQEQLAALQEASSDKTWSKEELMSKGEAVYKTNCLACHQANGAGVPGAHPALKGSPVAAGPVDKHIEIVLKGVKGTAMAPWASLNDFELAAVITYERNAWGNDTGDLVQPAAIKSAR